MNAKERRLAILEELKKAKAPVSATVLAKKFHVSRQIVVGDVALLRASGEAVLSTPRGYLLDQGRQGFVRAVVCRHDASGMERELNIMVDHGCTVLDVMVEHPVYGQLSGQLLLSNRYDVTEFIRKVAEYDAKPLSTITEGVHIHTLNCPDEAAFERVRAALAAEGFLLEE